MKMRKLLDPDLDVFVNDDLDADPEEGTFDDNWIVSARDLFRMVELTDNPFDSLLQGLNLEPLSFLPLTPVRYVPDQRAECR